MTGCSFYFRKIFIFSVKFYTKYLHSVKNYTIFAVSIIKELQV